VNLRELECFLAVADALHFGHAAERLHLAQPTVSESVRRLERSLGGDLFDRSTRNVALTDLGKAFLHEARFAHQQVEAAYETGRRLANRRSEQLVLGHAPLEDDRLLIALTAEVRRRHPHVTVVLEEIASIDQAEALRHHRIDAGLAWAPETDPDIGSMIIASCGYVVLVPETDPLAREKFLTLDRLAAEPLITWPRASNPLMYDRFAAAMDATGKPWSLVATATGIANLASRVMSSQGVGIIAAAVMRRHAFDGLCAVPLTHPTLRADRSLLWRKRTPHSVMPTLSRVVVRLFREHERPIAVAAS
jgi:DNA-binding transcriptional LysR family regulator